MKTFTYWCDYKASHSDVLDDLGSYLEDFGVYIYEVDPDDGTTGWVVSDKPLDRAAVDALWATSVEREAYEGELDPLDAIG